MDLSKYQLSEDVAAAILKDIESETAKLKSNRDDLLGEKKAIQTQAQELEQKALDAQEAAKKLAEEKLKIAGDMDGLKAHYEQELAEKTSIAEGQAKTAQEALDKYHKGSALNGALNLIHDDFKDLAKAQLSNMLKISYNDEGEAITSFEHEGKVVANNVEEFKGWAREQSAFKKILNGVDSSGAGAQRSDSASGANGDKDAAYKQRLKQAGLT